MSRQGAVTMRQIREASELQQQIEEHGLLSTAVLKWAEREEQKIVDTEANLRRLMATMGIPAEGEAFLYEHGLEKRFPPHQRVTLESSGLLFNYWAGDGNSKEQLQLILGVCKGCGKWPHLIGVASIADCAYPTTEHGQVAIEEWRCHECRKKP